MQFSLRTRWHHLFNFAYTLTPYIIYRPHSAAGACNTPWQYQTPFYDGVFCNLPEEEVLKLQPQDIASAVGVQSQTFVVVDDEDYFYPDLFSGMIVDEDTGHGVDLAIYTGSSESFRYRYTHWYRIIAYWYLCMYS